MDKSTHGSEPISQLDEFETWKVNEFIHRFKNVIDRNAIAIEVLREKLEENKLLLKTGRPQDIDVWLIENETIPTLEKSIELLTKK